MRSFALVSFLGGPLALVGCGGAPITGDTGATGPAQAVYASYQAGAKDRVQFTVSELDRGSLNTLASQSVNDLLGVPNYWLHVEQRGTELANLARTPRDSATDEWRQPILLGRFEELGRSLGEGTYELLGVRMTLDGQTTEHRALRVCWAAQSFCTVMDPVVNQLSAFAENRARLLAAGWAVKDEEDLLQPGERGAQATVCSLNSNPAATRRTLTWSGYTVDYKDVFGITLVHKSMGGQQTGIACYVSGTSCLSSGFGYSNTSSCYGNIGYNCDAANTGNVDGSTQPATRSWSETKSAHSLVLTADVNFQIQGQGASFSINWTTAGSVDSNGGQLYDACAFH
jgi:hypothetical protein